MSPPLVRFAPSPTGRLHLGNLRTALVNWLFARQQGGRFLLRIDDTDRQRSTEANAASIEADLRWLSLDWDLFARQSDRLAAYDAAADRLRDSGWLYPAFETAEELELKRKLALARGRPPIYDRAALTLEPAEIRHRIAAGERPSWRLRLAPGRIAWHDLVRGPVEFEAEKLSDPVLIRADGQPLYTLSSVVDDVEMGVTHVIRGEDHVANTAIQIRLVEALGGAVPAFGHFALIADAAGEKLSKRGGSIGLDELRHDGIEPMAVLSLLAKLGTSEPIELKADLQQLVDEFDIARFGRSRPKLDIAELRHLNQRLLHGLPYDAVRDRLPHGAGEALWLAVRGNVEALSDVEVWRDIAESEFDPPAGEAAFLALAAETLPQSPFDDGSWAVWTTALKQRSGRKGRELFLPLRLALTGLDHGPELAKLLPLIGRDRVLRRLSASARGQNKTPLP